MRSLPLLRLALALCGTLLAAPASALQILSHFEHYDPASETFAFSITFDGAPDLFTVDGFGNGKDEFQYWITWDLHPGQPLYPYARPDVLVRGGEIRLGGGIPIRDGEGDGGPNSGGWGPVRGAVPYQLVGNTITFNVSRAIIGDPEPPFAFVLGLTRWGGTTDTKTGVSQDAPTPVTQTSWGRIKRIFR